MSKLEKIYHLHEILRARRTPVSRQVLMERLGCSQATLYRLIASLRDELGAPIEQDPETKYFFYDRQLGAFELPGIWMSGDEIQALVAARAVLNRIQPGLLDEELDTLRERITSLLAESGLDADTVDRFIRIIHHGGRDVPREVFRAALTGLARDRRLQFTYRGRTSPEETERTVSPQRLTSYRENWYLDAWCHLRKGLRSFALERIAGITVSEESRKVLPDEELNRHFQSAYGIFAGPAEATAVLRFTPRMAEWVADERWHSAQEGRYLDDGRYELRVPYGRSDELVMDILRYGAEVEVVEPEALRQLVIERLRDALARYG
ncbi:MAG: transcriptional regulator [Xanthomonadales bacterium]|nr:transcriptional regulator [Xanthomonadales bacterium]